MVRILANYGSKVRYVFEYKGFNSRLDEVQASVLDVKLKYLDIDTSIRKEIAQYYIENITHSEIKLPIVNDKNAHVFHIFTIFTQRRDELQKYLADNGIQTLIHYPIPPHKQLCYKEWNNLSYPITELLHSQELSLPISPVMNMADVKYIVKIINKW